MATPVLIAAVTGSASGAIQVRGASCDVEQYVVYNGNTGAVFIQLFDAPSGTAPTVGTTVPKWSFGVPTVQTVNSPFTVSGLRFEGELWIAATTTATGVTGPTTAVSVSLAVT